MIMLSLPFISFNSYCVVFYAIRLWVIEIISISYDKDDCSFLNLIDEQDEDKYPVVDVKYFNILILFNKVSGYNKIYNILHN